MDANALRMLEHVHGHLGWLAVAALFHPAILLRRPQRRAPLAVLASVGLATVVSFLGGFLYYFYSHQLRRAIYTASRFHGLLFERKEHLAFAALGIAWAGALVHVFAHGGTDPERLSRARFVHLAFVTAAIVSFVVAVFGTIVGSFRTF